MIDNFDNYECDGQMEFKCPKGVVIFEDEPTCTWKYRKSSITYSYYFQVECGRKENPSPVMRNEKYCPSCGRKIEYVKDGKSENVVETLNNLWGM